MLIIFLLGSLSFVFGIPSVRAAGTICIGADGSIYPSTANITTSDYVNYDFTDNNYASIVVERSNITIDGNGYTLRGGFNLAWLRNVTIKNTTIENFGTGIYVYCCSNSTISGNNITATDISYCCGIILDSSSGTSISGNNVTNNDYGIALIHSSSSRVSGNNIANNNMGFRLEYSSSNTVSGNNMTTNYSEILIDFSSNNTISGNNITSGYVCIDIFSSSNNKIFHNNFVRNNNVQIYPTVPNSTNVWDDGYPSGGNYWSGYTGVDMSRGPYQNETGSDGIGDTPVVFNENNRDNYPLTAHDVTVNYIIPSKTVVGQGYSASIRVRVSNNGNYAENINLTVFADPNPLVQGDEIVISPQNVSVSAFGHIGESKEIALIWDTAHWCMGSYTLSALAGQVIDETETQDNARIFGIVNVTIAGDVTGDFFVNIKDATQVGLYWQHYAPPASPNVDIDGDGIIDIKDASIIGVNWQKHI
jgi:parallel beta-helix repeat protein